MADGTTRRYEYTYSDLGFLTSATFTSSASRSPYFGVTEMPGAENDPSPDNNVYIRVFRILSPIQQAKTTAHEAYGHAYLFDVTKEITDKVSSASHQYTHIDTFEWDPEWNCKGIVSTNIPISTTLENRIKEVVTETMINYVKNITDDIHAR